MAIETMLAVDFAMNVSIAFAVQCALFRLHMPTALQTAVLMSLNTLINATLHPPFWNSVPVQCAVCLLCGFLLSRSVRARDVMTASLSVFLATAAAAGLAALAGSLFPAAMAALTIFSLLLYRRRNPAVRWNIEITIEKNGVYDRFPALIDTGNRLTEHRSALPVLIIEESAVPNLSQLADALDSRELRTLGFGVLGSGGEMRCFHPDKILIHTDGGTIRGPDCWAALFEGIIPGRTRALAPPDFAGYTYSTRHDFTVPINHLRRISYAFFNRQTVHLRPRGADQARFGMLHRRQ